MTKICCGCNQSKLLEEFDLKKSGALGRRSRCKICRKIEHESKRIEISKRKKERYQKVKDLPETKAQQRASYERNRESIRAYRISRRENINQYKREYYAKNKEQCQRQEKNYRARNLTAINQRRRSHRQKNIDRFQGYENTYHKNRRKYDLQFRLRGNLRTRINHAMIARSESSQDLLGCSMIHFMTHLECQFKIGMTWENYGSYWSIDHIKPCDSFDLTNPEEQKMCFHWSNCQPLTVSENSAKGSKIGL